MRTLADVESARQRVQVANARIYIGFPKHVSPQLNGVASDRE
jgi:hypothetical protein